jgi:hypothetical protein
MSKTAALRASTIFAALTVIFAAIGLGAYSPIAEALSLITGSVFAVTIAFALATPFHGPALARARRVTPRR